MKPLDQAEIPKHKKRVRKKPWKVVWTFTGDLSKEPLAKKYPRFYYDMVHKYPTKKAAEQALEDWHKREGDFQYPSSKEWSARIKGQIRKKDK